MSSSTGIRVRIAALILLTAASSGVVLLSGFLAANEILFHGFAPICSDGNPEYDERYCGVSWGAGLPYLVVAVLALVVAVGCIWLLRSLHVRLHRAETRTAN